MNRQSLLTQLTAYQPFNLSEARHLHLTRQFIGNTPRAFERCHQAGGHVTAGFLVTNPARSHVLLNLHGLSGVWMNFGGHADGDENVEHVAKKELWEEAGIEIFRQIGGIFDVDVHYVAPHTRKGEAVPGHVHYDINYLAEVEDDVAYVVSDESGAIEWFTVQDALKLRQAQADKDDQLHRMYTKLQSGWR